MNGMKENGCGAAKPGSNAPRGGVYWGMTRFFVPLAIQGISMSLTYPLVASVVSHGRLGPSEYAAYAQGQTIMFLVGSVGAGMVTTGMVFARSLTGYRNFVRLSGVLGAVACALQLLCCVPPFEPLVFGRLLGMSGELREVARWTLLCSIPMNLSFFLRNPYFSMLYITKRSGRATFATALRIALTWILSHVMVENGLVGWSWGLVASTLGVMLEAYMFMAFTRADVAALEDTLENEKASVGRQLRFTLPLSLGGTLMTLSGVTIASFLSLTKDADVLTLPVHYIAMGIVNPLAAAATKMQSTVIAFPPERCGFGRVQLFAAAAGAALTVMTVMLRIPFFADWYFGDVQNLQAEHIPLASSAVLLVSVAPLFRALGSHAEGMAALRRRPNAILAGQAAYLAILAISLFALVHGELVPGYMAGCLSIVLATLASAVTVRVALLSNDLADAYGVTHARNADH